MEPLKKDVIIKGNRLCLRPMTVEDTDMVVRWRNSGHVVKNFIHREPISREGHLEWFRNKVEKGLVHQFIICRNSDGQPLGSVYLQNFEERDNKAEEGIFLGEEQAFGKGMGTEAAGLMIDYAFGRLGLHKLSARVLAYNQASLRMHEKAGYVREACFKEELFLDGKYEDLIFLGVINPGTGGAVWAK